MYPILVSLVQRDRRIVLTHAADEPRPELASEPELGHFPIAHDGLRRYTECLCGFLDGEPAEVAELDDLGFARIDLREGTQRFVQRHDVRTLTVRHEQRFGERDPLHAAAALSVSSRPRVVDEDPPH